MYSALWVNHSIFHTARACLFEWLEGTKEHTVATRSYWRYYQTIHEFLGIGTKAEGFLLSEITPIDVRSLAARRIEAQRALCSDGKWRDQGAQDAAFKAARQRLYQ